MPRADRLAVAAGLASAAAAGTLLAEARKRLAESRQRFSLLAALAEIGEGSATLEETVAAVHAILVPGIADIALLDVVQDEAIQRVGVRATGPRRAEIEAWLLRRPLTTAEVAAATRGVLRRNRPELATEFTDDELRGIAYDDEDAAQLAAVGLQSALTIPLRTRGRTLGALSLMVTRESGRRYGPQDQHFAEVMSGRVALALDNAGLFAELETLEAQLSAALGSLSDAVTVQTAQGGLLYANEAAARSMGFASPAELLNTPPEDIVNRYDSYLEDGTPLTVDVLPGRRVLAGEDPDPLLVRAVNRETGEERFNLVKASAVRDRDGNPRLAVNVIEDVTEAKRSEWAQGLLLHAGEVLASSLDYEQTLQQVAELAVPELGDWCGVNLPDRHGMLRQVAIAHRDPDKVRLGRMLTERYPSRIEDGGPSVEVLRTGTTVIIDEISDQMLRESARDDEHYEITRRLGMRAAMLVPLKVGGRAIGVLGIVSAESRKTFTETDVRLAEELGRRAGMAVENARLYTERSSIAASLQEGLLPQPLPEMPGWATAAWYRPAGAENSVGGDFYDAFEVVGGWMIVVGDVAGRGAPAAATTAVARHTLRTAAQLLESPLEAVARLNTELVRRGGDALCTLGVVLLRETEATVVCAGHPPLIHVHGGAAEPVGRFGPMLGAVEDATWEPATVALAEGDTLVLYTDGVLDTEGRSGRFGEERLHAVLAGAEGPGDAVARVEAAVLKFEHGEQADDTAVVAVGRLA